MSQSSRGTAIRRRMQSEEASEARLVADELERRAVEAGDRELLALREVDLDHLDARGSSAATTSASLR